MRSTVVGGWRGSVGRAVLTAAMLGLRDVLEPRSEEPVVEELDVSALARPGAAVEIDFVPGAPALTRCRVRPWLLGR